jgi:hypothetical protein
MARPTLFAAVLLAVLAVPAASSIAAPAAPAAAPVEPRFLRGSECLDPSFARSFTTIDNRSLVVDAGRYLYLIEVPTSCWALDYTNMITFRGDPISRRVCGGGFDAVLSRNEPPCRIERMSILSKDEYKAALLRREQWLNERHEARRARRAQKD